MEDNKPIDSLQPDPLYFWKKYEIINSSTTLQPIQRKSNVCRYCGKTDNETTFKETTHLLPELLGKNDFLTFDECDTCNNLFSDFESNLSIFIRPYITLLGIKGKKTIPAFQSRTVNRDEETRTIFKHSDEKQKELHIQNLDDYSLNTDVKRLDITFRKPSFIPLKVYKALVKIGLSLLPANFDQYNRKSFAWLTNREENITFIEGAFITTLKRSYFRMPSADLYKAKNIVIGNEEFPEYILILCFANQVIQIFLPFSDELKKVHDGSRNLSVNVFPAFAFGKMEKSQTVDIKQYNLGIHTPVTENHTISFSYKNAEINIPPRQ